MAISKFISGPDINIKNFFELASKLKFIISAFKPYILKIIFLVFKPSKLDINICVSSCIKINK